jgi:DNA-binding response OmpR family regulator
MSKVLLIEPDRVLATIYTRTLESAGYTVRHAISAEQAIQLVDATKPDAVIVSMEMARHNGVEFLYEFRSYSEWHDIPAIVLTNLPSTELLDDTVLREQLGVESVLVRSQTRADDLVRTLRRVARQET